MPLSVEIVDHGWQLALLAVLAVLRIFQTLRLKAFNVQAICPPVLALVPRIANSL